MASTKPFRFTLLKEQNVARAGIIETPHGSIQTPVFMPVGTLASVKSLDARDIEQTGAQIILANTYHLYLRPGTQELERFGGVQPFMHWHKPMLTDSGGFQVFSLGKQKEDHITARRKKIVGQLQHNPKTSEVEITDEGASFTSHYDGSKHFFTPEKSIEIQRSIGADIIMNFDECAPDTASRNYMEASVERTHAWAERCFRYWQENKSTSAYGNYQALFGIIQGGMFADIRQKSARFITGVDSGLEFDGIAVGGQTIGYNMSGTATVMDWIEPLLPKEKPRYAMGLGRDPQDLLDAVRIGFDMFDCVGPTRLARNGALYHGNLEKQGSWLTFVSAFEKGRINIGKTQFKDDRGVIQPNCDCYTCTQGYSRAYLSHLYRTKELTYYRLATIHNVRFMLRLTEQIRSFILTGAL